MSVDMDLGGGTDLLGDLDDSEGATPAPEVAVVPVEPEVAESHANMAFTTKKFALQALLDRAASVVPTKNTFPVLKNFFIEARPDLLRVLATDLELSVIALTQLVEVEEGQGGTAVFPAKKMMEILHNADEGEFHVEVTDGVAQLTCGRASWTLRLQSDEEYPDLPDVDEVTITEIDRGKFLGGLQGVRYAAPSQEQRPTLAMIIVSPDTENVGKMTACDGVRFQRAQIEGWPAEVDGAPFEIQIPVGAIDDLIKLLRTTDQPMVGIGSTDNQLIFRVNRDYFLANKLTAEFPDVESTLLRPALSNQDELTCDRIELLDAVKRVKINADEETSAIALEISPGVIRVMSRDKKGNRSTEELAAGWDKVTRTIVVNHQFLVEMLTMSDSRSLRFLLASADTKSKKSYLVLEDKDTKSLGVINQMRLDWMLD